MSFEEVARSSEAWLSTARRLRAAAHTLWQAADFERTSSIGVSETHRVVPSEIREGISVAVGLAGLALENIVKAVLIKRDPSLVTPTFLKKKLARHTLSELFREARIALDPIEEEFVFRAQQFVVWSSRYPVPLRASPQPPVEAYMGLSDDFETFDGIYNRVESTIMSGV